MSEKKPTKNSIDFAAVNAVELKPDAWAVFESEVKGKLKPIPHAARPTDSVASPATAGKRKPSA